MGMRMRIGKVTNIYPSTGKIKVIYEDEKSASLPLPMLTMNREYSMPAVGERVVTMHMENGSSKGFVLGTYYGGGMHPKATSGYRKDFGDDAYVICSGGVYRLKAIKINLLGDGAVVSLGTNASMIGSEVTIGSAVVSENEIGETEPDAYLKITADEAVLKAASVTVEADDITAKCSYGTITIEEMMKRIERIEDQLGLPHTI